jgi:uncharacterized protein (DUF1697 family)
MPKLIAFLRAINVGGRNVTMKELARVFESVGLKEVETFIASGNVIFNAPGGSIRVLEKKVEAKLEHSLGYKVKTFIRTAAEVQAVARYKPFRASMVTSAQAFNVAFLSEPLNKDAMKSLMALTSEIDAFHVHGREAYWLCQKKQSDSKFSNTRFEKVINGPATWRNINTVVRLASKVGTPTAAECE